MLRHLVLVKTDDSEERIASIVRVTRIGELGTMLVVAINRRNSTYNSVAFSPQADYTDRRLPLVGEF
jgi:hypothetical protein